MITIVFRLQMFVLVALEVHREVALRNTLLLLLVVVGVVFGVVAVELSLGSWRQLVEQMTWKSIVALSV